DHQRATIEAARSEQRLALLGGRAGGVDQHFALLSPIGGTVVERTLNPGQEVRSDLPNPSFVVSDPGSLWVYLDIAERDVGMARVGMALELRSAAYPGRRFTGVLDQIGDALDPATRTAKARGTVLNADHALKAE